MENPNWSRQYLEAELKMHVTAARYILRQLFERHGVNPEQMTIEDELGIGAMSAEDLPPAA